MSKAFAIIFAAVSAILLFILMQTAISKEMDAKRFASILKQSEASQILLIDMVKKTSPENLTRTLKNIFPRDNVEQNSTTIKVNNLCFNIQNGKITSFCK